MSHLTSFSRAVGACPQSQIARPVTQSPSHPVTLVARCSPMPGQPPRAYHARIRIPPSSPVGPDKQHPACDRSPLDAASLGLAPAAYIQEPVTSRDFCSPFSPILFFEPNIQTSGY